MFINFAIIAAFVGAFAIFLSPKVRRSKPWEATVTPLASIIGSGFLVSVPLLASAVGVWALPAVALLTGLAFLLGDAIRYNIRFGEPIHDQAPNGHHLKSIETLSHIVLIGAYFISVGYYLVLLSTFGLKLAGVSDPFLGKLISTALVAVICGLGLSKGLSGVEKAEEVTVSANLAAIAALMAGLSIFGLNLPEPYSWSAAAQTKHEFDWDTLRFLMGLVIIVQGFETVRFMGSMYDAETRVAAMKRSQIISTVVYLAFFALMIPLFPYFKSEADVASFIDVIGRVTPWLPFIVTAGAIASQFSASVADSIGASGLISDSTNKAINTKHSYILIGLVGSVVIWTTDVVSIVALASRAFALFYGLQCIVAMLVARRKRDFVRSYWYGALFIASVAIAIFGIPAG